MTRDEVIKLMESSESTRDWNANCDRVKAACGGYPNWWFEEFLLSGRANRIMGRFGESAAIRVVQEPA